MAVTSYAEIAARGSTCGPGGGHRNGMPMDRPYLMPSQREVLAVVAGTGRVPVSDLAAHLGRSPAGIRPTVASLALCGLLRIEERPGPVSVVLTGNGQRVAADLWPRCRRVAA